MTEKKKLSGDLTEEEAFAVFKSGGLPPEGPLTDEQALETFKRDASVAGKADQMPVPEEPEKLNPMSGLNLLPEGRVRDFLRKLDEYPMAGAQGLVKGTVSLPGLPGSVQELVQMPERETDLGNLMKSLPQAPTMDDVLRFVEEKAGKFKKYEGGPAYAESVGEFLAPMPVGKIKAGAKILDEAEKAARKVLSPRQAAAETRLDQILPNKRTVSTAVGGGVGSQGAADIAESQDMDPAWARLIGGLTGVLTGAKVRGANSIKIAGENAPSQDELFQQTGEAYNKIKNVSMEKPAYEDMLSTIAKEAKPSGVKKRHAPEMFKDLADLLNRRDLTYDEILAIRQEAGMTASDPLKTKAERRAASIIADNIDEYTKVAAPTNPQFTEDIAEATEKGRSQAKSLEIRDARERAFGSQMGEAIGQMNEVRAATKKRPKSYTPLEKKAIEGAVGRSARNPIRTIARGLQGFLTQGAGVGGAVVNASIKPLLWASGLGVLGRGAEKFIDWRTLKKLDDLEKIMRAGRPAQVKAIAEAKRLTGIEDEKLLRGILSAFRSQEINRGQE